MDRPDSGAGLTVERGEEGVVIVRLARPEVRNALNLALRRALAAAFRDLGEEETVRAIVLTGDERAFCAGADLGEYVDATPLDIVGRGMERLWGAVAACPKPVIAAVNGFAIGGGCELAMHADLIVAGRSARFGQPEVAIGLTPGGGATQRLPRVAGKFVAMRLMLTGDLIDAEEARAIGLVSSLVDDAEVLPEALRLARRIAGMPPLAVRRIKELVLASMSMPLGDGLRHEAALFQTMFATPEKTERMRAFLDRKRGKASDGKD